MTAVEEICREFGIVCMTRGGDERARLMQENAFLRRMAPHIRVLEAPAETRRISSTAVRERIAEIRKLEKEIADMVPPEILPYLRRELCSAEPFRDRSLYCLQASFLRKIR